MTKFYIARDGNGSLWLYLGEEPPTKRIEEYSASSSSCESAIFLYQDHPAGKDVSFEGGPVEVIFSTMAEFEMMKGILFSQKMRIAAMRCCQNCRKNYEDERCKLSNECAHFEHWEPIP